MSVEGSSPAEITAADRFRAAVACGDNFWRDSLLQMMQGSSHAQATLVCQIWTTLVSKQAKLEISEKPDLSLVCEMVLKSLCQHLEAPCDAVQKVLYLTFLSSSSHCLAPAGRQLV